MPFPDGFFWYVFSPIRLNRCFRLLEFSWLNNCVANTTASTSGAVESLPNKQPKSNIIDLSHSNAVGLPNPFVLTAPQVNGCNGVIISFIFLIRKLALYVYFIHMADVYRSFWKAFSAITAFKVAGVSQLLLYSTNNRGEIMDNDLGFYSMSSTVCRRVFMSSYTNILRALELGIRKYHFLSTLALWMITLLKKRIHKSCKSSCSKNHCQ